LTYYTYFSDKQGIKYEFNKFGTISEIPGIKNKHAGTFCTRAKMTCTG
jgi:hypothetical protein